MRFDEELRAELERLAKAENRTLTNYLETVLWDHVRKLKTAERRK